MWRFIKSIPGRARAVAQINWNSAGSAPQPVCHQDNVESNHRWHERCQSPGCNTCQTVSLGSSSSQYWKEEYSNNNDDNQGSENRAEKDSWFEEWLHGFRQKNGSFAQAYSMPEAVGWGAVLLLGSQFAHFRGKQWEANQKRYCPVRHFYRLACAMPISGTQARKHILPPTQVKPSTSGKSSKSTHDAHTSVESQSISASENTSENSVRKDVEDHPFASAEREWDKLLKLYDGIVQNSMGYRRAQKGQLSEAFSHWKNGSYLGYSKSHYNLGLCYELGKGVEKDIAKATKHYQYAADKGHPKAQYNLAILYLQGNGNLACDPQKALTLLEAAAEQGLPKAQTELGVLYTEDDRKDMQKAASLFQLAARHEEKTAQYYLAICYEQGWGCEENICRAAELYKKASDRGHAQASHSLGIFFEKGLGGLPEDTEAALELYHISVKQGNLSAVADAERLEKKLKESMQRPEAPLKHGLMGSASFSALTDYLQRHLQHLGHTDTDSSLFTHSGLNQPAAHIEKSNTLQADLKVKQVYFSVGDDNDTEDVADMTSSSALSIDYSKGVEQKQWNSGSRDSGFANESRSCSFNDLLLRSESDIDQMMVSCS